MVKFQLSPSSGSLKGSEHIKFVLYNVENKNGIRVKIDNITNSVGADILKVSSSLIFIE